MSRIVEISVAWEVACLGWRSSSSRLGHSVKGRIRPSGSASSSAASSDSSARAPVAEAFARRRVEQQCLDARQPRVQRGRGAVDHRRQRFDRLLGGIPFELESRERDAHPGAVALGPAHARERVTGRLRVAHPHPCLERPGAHVDREHVLAQERTFQPLGARELRQRLIQAGLPEAEHAAGMVEQDFRPRVRCHAE